MADQVTLQLGSVVFNDLALPTKITVGGAQKLVVHELVGGARVVDAMGRQDEALSWAGRFQGSDAVTQANALDALRVAGEAVKLTWHNFSYLVVVEKFTADFEQWYEVPYTISCVVVKQNTVAAAPTDAEKAADATTAVKADAAKATDLAAQVADPTLTALMAPLNSAIAQVKDFATATQSEVKDVVKKIGDVQSQVQKLISDTTTALVQPLSLGGLLPNNPAVQAVTRLSNQLTSYTQLPVLNQLQAATDRMVRNVESASKTGQAVATAGGDLMKLATKAYGDFTAWTAIARANNVTDPVVQGAQVLTVPAKPDASGGVLV